MANTKQKNNNLCVYCGKNATTIDHVPPKGLFAKPRPPLLKIPACNSCNQGYKLDDEYFKSMLNLKRESSDHSEVLKLKDKFIKAIAHPKARKFINRLIKNTSLIDDFSDSGVYLGQEYAYTVSKTRLDRIAARCISALIYKHFNELSINYEIEAYSIDWSNNNQTISSLIEELINGDIYEIGIDRNVFHYTFMRAVDSPETSVWLLSFYMNTAFIGFVSHK